MNKKSFRSVLAERGSWAWAWVRCRGPVTPHSHPSTPALCPALAPLPLTLNPALFSAPHNFRETLRGVGHGGPGPSSRRHILLASTQVSAAHLPRGSFPGIRTPFVSIFDLPTQAHFVEFGTEGILRPMQRALRTETALQSRTGDPCSDP